MFNKSAKTALAAILALAAFNGAAAAQDNATHAGYVASSEIFAMIDANHNRVEEKVLAYAEMRVATHAARIADYFAGAGYSQGAMRYVTLHNNYTDCAL